MCIVRERCPAGFLDMKCQTCFASYYAFKQFSKIVPIMLKKVPIMVIKFALSHKLQTTRMHITSVNYPKNMITAQVQQYVRFMAL